MQDQTTLSSKAPLATFSRPGQLRSCESSTTVVLNLALENEREGEGGGGHPQDGVNGGGNTERTGAAQRPSKCWM
jgi:hypothetical protein